MKITKQRLKEIIKEELEYTADIDQYAEPEVEEDPMASRLGTREEQLLSRILARAVVDKYDSYEDLANDLGLELDIRMLGWLRSLKANPMYGSSLQEGRSDQELLNALIQAYGRRAAHITVKDIQKLHPSYKGSLTDIADGLGLR